MSVPDLAPAMAEPQRYGEVYDRGYQHYDGERLGRKHAFGALIRYSIQRSLGIKKRWTAKIVPIIIYVAAAGSVLIMIGIEAFIDEATMNYAEFFTILLFPLIGLFVATTAPEMLCSDRRENVLALYFSRAYLATRLRALEARRDGDPHVNDLACPADLLLAFPPTARGRATFGTQRQRGRTRQNYRHGDFARVLPRRHRACRLPPLQSESRLRSRSSSSGWGITEAFVGIFTEAVSDRSWSDYLSILSPTDLRRKSRLRIADGSRRAGLRNSARVVVVRACDGGHDRDRLRGHGLALRAGRLRCVNRNQTEPLPNWPRRQPCRALPAGARR